MKSISKTSPDILKERLEQLKKLFPDLFTNEGNLNEEELKNFLSQYTTSQTERYEFRWAGKAHSKKLAFTPSKATLVPDEKRSVDFDKTENIIIEGDNLEVLKLLQKPYFNQIKCIYIDPPYNTGNDFIYNDDFSESKKAYWEKGSVTKDGVKLDTNSESVGRYHSNWLDMMQSRLLLARNLLKEDGVIFVSIDDHELSNLRKLMDEIFGEENFIQQVIWKKRNGPPNDKVIAATHEYILCYSKNLENVILYRKERTQEQIDRYKNPDNHPKGPWTAGDLMANVKGGRYVKSLYFPIINPNTGEEHYPSSNGNWRFNKQKIAELITNNEIYFGENGKGRPKLKRFFKDVKEGVSFDTIWNYLPFNNEATAEIGEIFGNLNFFDTPKPSGLIKEILELSTRRNDLILDFFAGSGTTGQAVMELNKQDNGNRKFILVQLPESTHDNSDAFKAGYKTISDICIKRIKKAGEKVQKEDKKVDTGFKVLKLTYSHFPENLFSPDPNKSEEENIQAFDKYLEKLNQQVLFDFDFDKLFYEIALKDGFNLNFKTEELKDFKDNKIVRIKDDLKDALVCLDQSISDKTIEVLKTYKDQRFICLKRAVDTTKKWNLQQLFDKNLWVA